MLKLLSLLVLVSSCSLLEKRKDHYGYLKEGVTIDEVKTVSGNPDAESFDNGETVLTYGYCPASYLKEGVLGALTLTMYNWHCNLSYTKMNLYFKDGVLFKKEDDVNRAERSEKRRAIAESMDEMNSNNVNL